ncbi:MAG: heme exporter protein CcmD [Xanthobacteraceae bacterium]|jgi:heme exporter protein CcmD|nr:heme exporter protein CcmD [Xanthobacteraceae bacterium]
MVHLHTTFIATAYGFAAFVLCALFVWAALDYRAQCKALAELEARRAKKK